MRYISWLFLGAWMVGLNACSNGGTGPASEAEIAIALQVDAEGEDLEALVRICSELDQRDISATLFVTSSLANRYSGEIHQLYVRGFEVSLLSSYLGEMSHDEQSQEIDKGLSAVSGCLRCQTDQPVHGIRPARFVQNEDTYQLVDSLQFAYNAGFQACLLYAPGHERDVHPYRIEGYDFFAVPVSTAFWQGERVCLSDQMFQQRPGADPDQWGELLVAALDEAIERGEPLVVVVHDSLTGAEDSSFWPPLVRFLTRARERGVRFLTTEELVIEFATN